MGRHARDCVLTPCALARSQVPGLAVVIVGSRKDSQTYVNMKRKACAEVGICSIDVDLPEDISEPALVAEVHRLNADPAVHGTASVQYICVIFWSCHSLHWASQLMYPPSCKFTWISKGNKWPK